MQFTATCDVCHSYMWGGGIIENLLQLFSLCYDLYENWSETDDIFLPVIGKTWKPSKRILFYSEMDENLIEISNIDRHF